MKVPEYLANCLVREGVSYVFGVPGGASIAYMEAFREAGITFILTANEASAAIMADVTARLTGIPGVCHATLGPGATNISTGVGGALLDRSPVIVLTSETGEAMRRRTTQMNIDHQGLFAPITRGTFRLSPNNARSVIPAAFRMCREERPGPVHIGLPSGIEEEEVKDHGPTVPADRPVQAGGIASGEIISLLRTSSRPLIVAGLTAVRLNAGRHLTGLLDATGLPLAVTPMASGLIPRSHPSHAGVLAHALSDYLDDLISSCDLVIGFGYDPVEYDYEAWLPDVPLIHFDTADTDLPPGRAVFHFTGTPDKWAEVLKTLGKAPLVPRQDAVKGIKEEMNAVFEGFTSHFGPVTAMKVLREELPADVTVTADVGSHLHLLGQYWESGQGGRVIMTNGWSCMGFGLPAALAAALVNRQGTTVCITGDGGFLMMAGEIITARRYNLPVVVVVFSDGELNLIKIKQSWQELAPYGTVLYRGDLFGAGQFFGTRVLKADSEESMRKAVITALTLNEPVIINAMIEPDDYRWLITRRNGEKGREQFPS